MKDSVSTIAQPREVETTFPILPVFPEMRAVTIDDRDLVTEYAEKFLPYSTFNFTNFWSWNVYSDRKIAELNDNLVLQYSDYESKKPFLTFLGTHKPNETAEILLQHAANQRMNPNLRFVTEETARLLTHDRFIIEEDRDNADYVYNLQTLAYPTGHTLKSKHRSARRFVRENPDAVFEISRINSTDACVAITKVFERWKQKKALDKKPCESSLEEIAITRLAESAGKFDVILSNITLGDHMIGFSIDEVVHDRYVIGHFIKADNAYKGIYEYLNEHIAKYLKSLNKEYWNWQQDLNIDGLRQVKLSYHPSHFLKKYSVSLKE